MRDFIQAIRGLSKSPAMVAVAIASLALGIGANVTVFSVVREMILDDLSARRPDRLSRVEGADVSYSLYRDLRVAGAFEDVAFHRGLGDRIWRTGARNEIVWALTTSANFFDVLDIRASRGRLYSQADEGRELAVVSSGFWRRRLDGDANALGRPIQLNGKLYTIVGVLPPDYRSVYGHGVSPEVYLSDPGNTDPHDRVYGLFGRQRDGFSREQTRQALNAAVERLRGPSPLHRIVELRPMSGLAANSTKLGDERRFFLFFVMLFGVAGMLALIACSNVAGLLVARALARASVSWESVRRLAPAGFNWQGRFSLRELCSSCAAPCWDSRSTPFCTTGSAMCGGLRPMGCPLNFISKVTAGCSCMPR